MLHPVERLTYVQESEIVFSIYKIIIDYFNYSIPCLELNVMSKIYSIITYDVNVRS